MELQWIQEYDDDRFGQGLRSTRDIPMKFRVSNNVVLDVKTAGIMYPIAQIGLLSDYCFAINTSHYVNVEKHWVVKINHCPMPPCNLRFTAKG